MPQIQLSQVQPIKFRCRFETTVADVPSGHEFCVFEFPGCKGCPKALHPVRTVERSDDPMKSEAWRAWVRAFPAPRNYSSLQSDQLLRSATMPIHWQAAPISMIFGRHCEISKVAKQLRNLLGFLTAKDWVWKAAIVGPCGSVTYTLLMLGKAKVDILESFQPYQSLQIALGYWTGEYVHPLVPWLLSHINGSTAAAVAFAKLYRHLPGSSGPAKGFIAGVIGWLAMDLIFFPLLGLGPFATHLGFGLWPALFSLGMMLAYSVVMGVVYSIMDTTPCQADSLYQECSPLR